MAEANQKKTFPGPPCPKCRHELKRINRKWMDKLLNKILFVRRYRCLGCLWEGIIVTINDPETKKQSS